MVSNIARYVAYLALHFTGVVILILPVSVMANVAQEPAAVEVPLNMDYPLLQTLVVAQLFTGPDKKYQLLDDPSGCNSIELSNPQLSPQADALQILAEVDAELGVELFGGCRTVFAWEGEAGFLGIPVLSAEGDSVSFDPQDTWLTLANGSRLAASTLPAGVHQRLKSYYAGYRLDLSPQLQALDSLLHEVLPSHQTQQLRALVNSLRISQLLVAQAALEITVSFDVPPVTLPPAPLTEALSEEELKQWEQRWQMMDELLVEAIKHYAAATELRSLRLALLDILLESRYRLRDALVKPATRDNDVVRSWFMQSWQNLAPTIRKIALEHPGQEQLLWLSLLGATDALRALDQLGPGFGLDISTAGLRTLARLINAGEAPLLEYDNAVDPQLQQLFELQPEVSQSEPSALYLNFSLFSRARAATPKERLNKWVPSRKDLGDYLPLVANLLTDSAEQILVDHPVDARYEGLYKRMVWATAWQESCWRQYMVKDSKRVPLRSNSGDVGLMQINERVWRGFFDQQKLRWDITYNVDAGTRILRDYLVKYALRKGEHHQPGGLQNLARASYSAYNGGPSQVARYRRVNPAPYHRKVDSAFWNKYQQIEAGTAEGVSHCLGGNIPLDAAFGER